MLEKSRKKEQMALYNEIAAIHKTCINQGFLSTLGVRFLALLYESIHADLNSVLFVEYVNGKVAGFVAGGRGMRSVYIQILKRWPRLLLVLLPILLSPSKLKRIIEIVCFSRRQKTVSNCPHAELFSIAVVDVVRGKGISECLYKQLALHFTGQKEPAFCIVVGDQLSPAHRFYQRMGAVPIAQLSVHHGQRSTIYRQDLPYTN